MGSVSKDLDFERMKKIADSSPDIQETIDRIADYTVGFVHRRAKDAQYLGSGTLVSIEGRKAILTAEHVMEKVAKEDYVCLALPTRFRPSALNSPRIDLDYVTQVRCGSSKSKADGPDLAVLLLLEPAASVIPSTKNFYNLSKRRQKVLEEPWPVDKWPWLLSGVADEWTRDGPPEAGFERVIEFDGAVGFGIAENERIVGGFDYLDFVAEYGENYSGPERFGGYSGGSVWQMPCKLDGGKITVSDLILSGVAFWQSGKDGSQRVIKCHGRMSIYQHLIDRVMGS